jgi:hypothetical protein
VKHPKVGEEALDSRRIMLSYPLRPRPWIAGIARRLGQAQDRPVIKRLELDEMGSAAWRLMDGRRTVAGIIQSFSEAYQLDPREAEVSITLFIRELGKRGIIGLSPEARSQHNAGSGD